MTPGPRHLLLVVLALALAGCSLGDEHPARTASAPPASAAGAGSGRWIALHPATLWRTEVGAARIGSAIYVVGGFLGRGDGGATTAAVERYDIERDRWRRVRSMPIGVNHPATVAHGGRLYVIGGYTGDGGLSAPTAAVQRYDPRTNRWTRLRDMPTRRAALTAGVIDGRIYAAGGAAGGDALRTLEVFDIARGRWSTGPRMQVAREHLGGAVTGGRLYVLAGRAAGVGNLAVAESYDPRTRRWRRLPDMGTPRGGIAAATVAGTIVVFGGEEFGGPRGTVTIPEVERYDPARRTWSRLADMRHPRHGLGGAAFGRRVFAIEGGRRPGFAFSRDLEALDIPR
jgi:N-acetylneuraminic acid mutarotase